jgi:hypothetical protein
MSALVVVLLFLIGLTALLALMARLEPEPAKEPAVSRAES